MEEDDNVILTNNDFECIIHREKLIEYINVNHNNRRFLIKRITETDFWNNPDKKKISFEFKEDLGNRLRSELIEKIEDKKE